MSFPACRAWWLVAAWLGLAAGCFDELDPTAFDVPRSDATEDGSTDVSEDGGSEETAADAVDDSIPDAVDDDAEDADVADEGSATDDA